MKSYTFASFLSALVAVASAYTTPVNGPSGNPIGHPTLHEQVPVGGPFTITWNPTYGADSTVTLVLLKGPSNNVVPVGPIVEFTANSGSYVWANPQASFPSVVFPDSTEGWGIQLIVDSDGTFQYSTQFGFANTGVTEEDEVTTTSSVEGTTISLSLTSSVEATSTLTSEIETSTTEVTTTTEVTSTTTTSSTTEEETTSTTTTEEETTSTTEEATSTTEEPETTSSVEEKTTFATSTAVNATVSPSKSAPPATQTDSGVARQGVQMFAVAGVAAAVAALVL